MNVWRFCLNDKSKILSINFLFIVQFNSFLQLLEGSFSMTVMFRFNTDNEQHNAENMFLFISVRSGIAMLTFALLMSARMGIFQEKLYKQYGKHSKEALFYNVSFPLPATIRDAFRGHLILVWDFISTLENNSLLKQLLVLFLVVVQLNVLYSSLSSYCAPLG